MSDGFDPYYLGILDTMSRVMVFSDEQVKRQRASCSRRMSVNQYLDENENEWMILDRMCRMRPWATNKDKPFAYPFRKATQEMREAGEMLWLGDTASSVAEESKPSRRGEAPSELLTNLVSTKEYPPAHRVLLFSPEMGSARSYDAAAWGELQPKGEVDIWAVSCQGWSNFDDMIREVYRWVETFADGVSTVWFGHSLGAIVLYECLKRMHQRESPCLPVAVCVSGCPAPHAFVETYKPTEMHPWLNKLRTPYDFEGLEEKEAQVFARDFSVLFEHSFEEEVHKQLHYGIMPPEYALGKLVALPKLQREHRNSVLSDLKLLKSYMFDHQDAKPILVPLIAFKSDADNLVPEVSMDAWAEYTAEQFEVVDLGEHEDSELLDTMGHGYARVPPKTLLKKVQEVARRYQINKDVDDDRMLPDVGPTDGPIPEETEVLIVGSGVTGVCAARSYAKRGFSLLMVDKAEAVGGIWKYYANVYSRVNTSEVGYRLLDQEGPTARPNQDHSPRHDIMRDLYQIASEHAHGRVRCCWEVTKTAKQPDDTYIVTMRGVAGQGERKIRAKVVVFAVNRRIGKRRDVTYDREIDFRGDICYGYANELKHLKFWGKRVIIVGAGAFAFENLRTAIEHGAKHVTILGRRSGTTCPKWIDMIAFIRPTDENYMTNKAGNMISFEAWRACYQDAGLELPSSWNEGLLKPHNHTISVSDLAYIGGFHGMVDLRVGEINRFRSDGHGVELVGGGSLECDIVIKCTGFHLNDQVPKITGKGTLYSCHFLDFNMPYIAEPLLDGGQFGSSKGAMESSDLMSGAPDGFLSEQAHLFSKLPPPLARMFQPTANPFGSGYVGMVMGGCEYAAWLAQHPKEQEVMLRNARPRLDAINAWTSHLGLSRFEELKEIGFLAAKTSK